MSVSFGGFLENTATFIVEDKLDEGTPVMISDNYTVEACEEDDGFCGFVVSSDESYAAVQLRGVVTCAYSGTAPDVGYAALAADGDGGVAEAESGTEYLILSVDSTAGTITFLM